MVLWKLIASLLLIGLLQVASGLPCFAEEVPPTKRVKVDLALGTWITVGDTRWSHDASTSFPLGNPTSRLIYQDHSANVVELTAKLSVGPRFFGRLNVGGAGIGGGRLVDDDFLSPDRGSPSSRTHSDIDGSSLFYLNADVGTRLSNLPNNRGTLDGFIGFQYWRQKHEAYGVRQVHCSAAGTTVDLDSFSPGVDALCAPNAVPVSNAVLAISNTSTWYSLRTGVQGEYRVTRWLSVHGSAVLKPINLFTNEDTHHLRVVTGELQDPSFTMIGVGFGADADIGAKLYVTKYLAVQVGYRVWWNRMIDGTWESHATNGQSVTYPLTEMQSLRHGLTAGINLSF